MAGSSIDDYLGLSKELNDVNSVIKTFVSNGEVATSVLKRFKEGLKENDEATKTIAGALGLAAAKFNEASDEGNKLGTSLKEGFNAFKAADGGMKALKTASSALKGGLMELGFALAGMAITGLIDYFAKLKEHEDLMRKSSEDLGSVTQGLGSKFLENYKDLGHSIKGYNDLSLTIDDLAKKHVELKGSIRGAFNDVYAKSAEVGMYADTIERLANNGSLNAKEQADLQIAVEGYNKICGTTIGIVDATTGALDTSIDSIKAEAKAWEENALAQAAQEKRSEIAKNIFEIQLKLYDAEPALTSAKEKVKDLADQLQEMKDAGGEGTDEFLRLEAQLRLAEDDEKKCTEAVKEYQTELDNEYKTLDKVNDVQAQSIMSLDSYSGSIKEAITGIKGMDGALDGINIDGFSEALSKAGISSKALANQQSDDIAAMARAWQDGTLNMTDVAESFGVSLPDTIGDGFRKGTPEVMAAVVALREAGIQDPVSEIEGLVGMSVDEGIAAMKSRLHDAVGVSEASDNLVLDVTEPMALIPEEMETSVDEGIDAMNARLYEIADLSNASENLALDVVEPMNLIPEDMATAIDEGITAMNAKLYEMADLSNASENLVQGVTEPLSLIPESMETPVDEGIAAINAKLNEAYGVKDSATSLTDALKETIQSEASDAPTWGTHLVEGLASGIRGAVDVAKGAASAIAGSIRAILGFSRPDEGPLREYETWMPHMIDGLATTMRKATPALYAQAKAVADGISENINDWELEQASSSFEDLLGYDSHLSYGTYAGEPVAIYNVYLNDWKLNDTDEMRDVTIGTLVELVRKGQM